MDARALGLLVNCLEDAGIESLEVHDGRSRLRILMDVTDGRRRGTTRTGSRKYPAQDQASAGRGFCQVLADASGKFLIAHPVQAEAFVQPGDPVKAGQVLALLKVGMLYRAIVAERAGTVGRLLASDGDLVELNAPLFEMEYL